MADDERVYDLDAAIDEFEGAEPEPFRFSFDGEEFELPGSPNVFAWARVTSSDGDEALRGLKAIFGADQFDRLEACERVFDARALAKLVTAYAEYAQVDLGEALASPAPSNRAARRSNPTSPGSMASISAPSARGA
jgi:hypothetical protein